MTARQFEVWIADLSPRIGTETGKTRPVLIVQTDLLNQARHPSTIICPMTTNVNMDADILRVHVGKGEAQVTEACDIMMDQLRAIDNKRLLRRVGKLQQETIMRVRENIAIVLDIQ